MQYLGGVLLKLIHPCSRPHSLRTRFRTRVTSLSTSSLDDIGLTMLPDLVYLSKNGEKYRGLQHVGDIAN